MPRPLLPPRGVFTPTKLIYHPQLPPAVLLTWIQLRGLAWGSNVTPPLSIKDLSTLTGSSPATLYRHLTQLRSLSCLSWQAVGQAGIIISFTEKSWAGTQDPRSTGSMLNSQKRESLMSNSQKRESRAAPSPLKDSQNRESQVSNSQNRESRTAPSPLRNSQNRESQVSNFQNRESYAAPSPLRNSQNRDPQVSNSQNRESRAATLPLKDSQNRESQALNSQIRESGVYYSPDPDALHRGPGVLGSPDPDALYRGPGELCSPDPDAQNCGSQSLDSQKRESQAINSQKRESQASNSQKRETPILKNENPGLSNFENPASLNPLNNSSMNPVFKKDLKDLKESESNKVNLLRVEGEEECEEERDFAIFESPANSTVTSIPVGDKPMPPNPVPAMHPDLDPVSAYRSLAHLTPTRPQRRLLAERITNLPIWRSTVEHWLMHAWNPRNLTGMLELYQRGGAEGCRYCHKSQLASKGELSSLEHSLAAIEAVRCMHPPPDSLPNPWMDWR